MLWSDLLSYGSTPSGAETRRKTQQQKIRPTRNEEVVRVRARYAAEVAAHLHAGAGQIEEELEHWEQLGALATAQGVCDERNARRMAREQVHYTDHLQTVDR